MEIQKETKITISRKNGVVSVSNSDGLLLEVGKLSTSSVLLALIHQTLLSRFELWDGYTKNVEIELSTHEVVE